MLTGQLKEQAGPTLTQGLMSAPLVLGQPDLVSLLSKQHPLFLSPMFKLNLIKASGPSSNTQETQGKQEHIKDTTGNRQMH